jgi:hypothetical protein
LGEYKFRKIKKGALDYFTGGDSNYPNFFVLKPWIGCGYDNNERVAEVAKILVNIGMDWGQFTLMAKTLMIYLLTSLFISKDRR